MEYTPIHSNLDIETRTMGIALSINNRQIESPTDTIMVCALPNGYRFFSDVMKFIAFNVQTDFCNVSTDWLSTVSRFSPSQDEWYSPLPDGNRIYIFVDEIDDTDKCIEIARFYKFNFNPSELYLCGMLRRKSTLGDETELNAHYSKVTHLFTIEDGEDYCGNGVPDLNGGHSTPPTIYKITI